MAFSFTDALCSKYGEEIMDCMGTTCEIFVVGSAPSRSTPDGRYLIIPKSLSPTNSGISTAGCERTIRELCHDVSELDLTQNQLCDLKEVDKIISKMSRLWFLNLSRNDFEDSNPVEMTPATSIRSLVLNHTHIPWEILTCFLDAMPNLQELHLSLNNYTCVEMDSKKRYPSIKILHISGNPIKYWEDVVRLGQTFPNLDSLTMVDGAIETIPDPNLWTQELPTLRCLTINNGPLKDWDDIDRLNSLPQLEDIRVLGLPLLEDLQEVERRQHLIARLPKATKLNGSDISQKEREESERAFIRYFLDKEDRPKRFYDLEAIHGQLQPLVEIDFTVKKTARVEVHYCDRIEIMTFDLYKTVLDLKNQLSSVFNLRMSKMRVFYLDHEMIECHGAEELKFNSRRLYAYGVHDNDQFMVYAK